MFRRHYAIIRLPAPVPSPPTQRVSLARVTMASLRRTLYLCHPMVPCLASIIIGSMAGGVRAETASGPRAVFEQKCAVCHGTDGQGTPGVYEIALSGSRSVDELARLIERTMPEDNPEDCVGEEARQVARYMYEEFYSPGARQRKGLDRPLQVEFTRLTVEQHRQAIADIVGHFTPSPQQARRLLSDRPARRGGRGAARGRREGRDASDATQGVVDRGLRASYFASRGMSKADRLIEEQIDKRIDFDFQQAAPMEDMPDDQFAIVWEGALTIHETGEYQLRVTTPNGARVYLNLDPTNGLFKLRDDSAAAGQLPLIDAWVGSGNLREESARVFLLGGRRYPLRVEFFKYQEPTASLKLEWKPPHGVWSVLDDEHLTTADVGRTFVVETPFPADDRSLGFERGSSVAPEWHAAVTSAAIEAAEEVVSRLPLLARDVPPVRGESVADADDADDVGEVAEAGEDGDDDAAAEAARVARRQRLQEFVVEFARVAFRRPLTDQQVDQLREHPFSGASSPEMAVRRAIVWILCSPEFLYADLTPPDQPPSPHAVANRLALALWDSIPDAELMAAAEAGALGSREQVETQTRRTLDDPRARHKLRSFFEHWLELEDRDLAKDQQLFPQFDDQVIADLRQSLQLLLDETVWSDASDYRQLLLAEELWLSPRLLPWYGDADHEAFSRQAAPGQTVIGQVSAELDQEEPAGGDVVSNSAEDPSDEKLSQGDTGFARFEFASGQRAGVLTHPYLLSALAYHNNTSPIHRGVFLTRNVLGRALRPPPVAISFEENELPADLTMREKVTHLTQDSNCMACHAVINPLGFALENFDALGRWRDTDNGRAVDSTSLYDTQDGETVELASARDVAELAVSSEAAHRAFVIQLFQHMTKQNPGAYGPEVIERLRDTFAADQFHIQNLMVRIAVLSALHGSVNADASTAQADDAPPDSTAHDPVLDRRLNLGHQGD
jgi:hypothetical protein